jgi:2-deoxy-D-gluconate 3-dehydrogenase
VAANFLEDLFSLRGKVALVTGARRGIGYSIAEGLAAAGADIIGVSHSLDPKDSEIRRAVEKQGRRFSGYQCDFSRPDQLHDFIQKVQKEHDAIDILVNNAGTIRRAPLVDHSDEAWAEVLSTNLTAPFILTRDIGRSMLARGRGKIIFIASLLSFQGGITVPGYAASKGGIARLIQSFANEWAGKGLHINGIAPGYFATDNTQALRADDKRATSILERIPQGRWGDPRDLVGPAVFLASKASDYLNGSVVTVDGGWMGR